MQIELSTVIIRQNEMIKTLGLSWKWDTLSGKKTPGKSD